MGYFYGKATNEVKHFLDEKDYTKISTDIDGILHYDSRVLTSQNLNGEPQLCDVMLDLSETPFCVPITDKHSPIAYAIVSDIHWHHKDAKHLGVETLLRYSNMVSYIIGGRSLAKKIKADCIKCRLISKKAIQVKMGLIPAQSLKIAPPFYRTQVDIFGPFDSFSNLNKRKTIKIWFSIFCCTSTSAGDIKVMEDYSTESFLLAFVRFSCRFGFPKYLLPDEGSQLIKACKSMILNFSDLKHQLHSEYGVRFEPCPVNAHYMHGKVERKIREVKKSMTLKMGGNRLSILQWETLGYEVANTINNLPIALGNKVSDLENLDILTPNRLLLGRNNNRCPAGPFTAAGSFKHVLENNEAIYQAWFKSWLVSYVPTLIERAKWHKSDTNLKVRDIVLFLKTGKEFEKQYQYGIIRGIEAGRDGLVRKADVEYQNASEGCKRITRRGARDLIVVHPVDKLSINKELSTLHDVMVDSS